jgi:hypothetical protein
VATPPGANATVAEPSLLDAAPPFVTVTLGAGGESPLAVFAFGSGAARSVPGGVVEPSVESVGAVVPALPEVEEPEDVPVAVGAA